MNERLPIPDWERPGETWRIEAEKGWEPRSGGVCSGKGCYRETVAWRPRDEFGICARHLRETVRAWIEHGQIVGWRLSP